MKTAVITDSSCNLSLDYINKHDNLTMIPLTISIDGTFYRDLVEIDYKTVYSKLDQAKVTTSLPLPQDFEDAVKEFKEAGYTDIVVITISSGLSGTFNSFNTLSNQYEGVLIHMYDSKTLAMGLGYLVKQAIKSIEEDKSVPRIVADLNQLRFEDTVSLFTVETLKYLRQGGRIGKVEGTIGELLHVKPVIFVNDEGVYETKSKGFGMKRTLISMRKILQKEFGDEEIEMTIHYGDKTENAEDLKEKLQHSFNVKKIDMVQLTPVLGIHTGPEMLAIIAKRV